MKALEILNKYKPLMQLHCHESEEYLIDEAIEELKKLTQSNSLSFIMSYNSLEIDTILTKLEPLTKLISCDGCKHNIKHLNYDMDTGIRLADLSSDECYACSRNHPDKYENKKGK